MSKNIQLKGRVLIHFGIRAVTGLHIGGSDTGIEIGGVDKTVIRDPLTNQPYIPGSSLKGKMRSLLEKYRGLQQNQRIGQGFIHSCEVAEEYQDCDVCQVFGVPGERPFATPTRLVVRDIHMNQGSAEALNASGRTDLPYTEVKTEVSIDRVTAAANPRQMERVPADTLFSDAELVYSIYQGQDGDKTLADPSRDIKRLQALVEGLQLMEDDYLGGLGTRGSGKVRLEELEVFVRKDYLAEPEMAGKYDTLAELAQALPEIQARTKQLLGIS